MPDAMPSPLPRPVLLARITVLQGAINDLALQAGYDGRGAYGCLGAMQRELSALQAALRARDRQADVEDQAEVAVG